MLTHYKLERFVRTHPHVFPRVVEYIWTHVVGTDVIMVHNDTLKRGLSLTFSTHVDKCKTKLLHAHINTETATPDADHVSFF